MLVIFIYCHRPPLAVADTHFIVTFMTLHKCILRGLKLQRLRMNSRKKQEAFWFGYLNADVTFQLGYYTTEGGQDKLEMKLKLEILMCL